MRIKKVLIVYKKSSYETHALGRKDPNYLRLLREGNIATRKSKAVHREHRASFEKVKAELRALSLRFDVRLRYYLRKIRGYDLVVTIGGDGTFLETSHFLEEGLLMGINSAPSESVGFYCRANRWNFRRKLVALLRGRGRLQKLPRLRVDLSDGRRSPFILNDVLFTSRNPAGTTRYLLTVGKVREEQKSSGLWIAPAPGSTAAIRSAGGRILPLGSEKFQYVVREPYQPPRYRYRLAKGMLDPGERLKILSMMDEAVVYVDGPHLAYPVKRGVVVTIRQARKPVHAVW